MTVGDWVKIIRARWRVVLTVTLAGVALGVTLTFLLPTKDQARSTIFVSASASTTNTTFAYQGNLLSEQRVKSYTQLLSGSRISSTVVQQLGLPESPGSLASRISANATPDTTLITLTVTDSDPARALRISNAVGVAFTDLVTQLEQPAGAAQPPAITARVVEPPVVSEVSLVSRLVQDAGVGLLVGVALGLGAALLRNALDNTIKDAETLRETTGTTVLGSVSYSRSMAGNPLALRDPSQLSRAEEYRQLRTTFQYVDVDRLRKSVVMTSSVPAEGKTTTACNLAIALNRAGSSVILVEGDLRRPRVADNLGVTRDIGLTNVLAHTVDLDHAIQRWKAEDLDVLTSGPLPPNPSELLGSGQMNDLVTALLDRYEVVLIDAPPLLPVSDGAALAALCDGVVVVARHGKTSKAEVRKSLSILERVGANVYGSVLSMTPDEPPDSYGDYQVGDTRLATRTTTKRPATGGAPRSRVEDDDAITEARPAVATRNGVPRPSTANSSPPRIGAGTSNGHGNGQGRRSLAPVDGAVPSLPGTNGSTRASGAHTRRERRT